MIDLLLISDEEKQHYCWIKNMSWLVSQRTKNHSATLICRWCISHFTHLKSEHDKHMAMCRGIKHSPQADRMPNPKKGEDIFKFKNWKRRMQVPYYFIADFEAMPITLPSQTLEALKKTKKIQEHILCSFSYIKIRYDGVSEASKMYVGKNAETKFVIDITREAFQIQEEYKDPKPMLPLTAQEQRRHNNATHCWVCKKEFSTQEVWISTLDGERYKAIYNGKVKDHCHITGKYRGPALEKCTSQ